MFQQIFTGLAVAIGVANIAIVPEGITVVSRFNIAIGLWIIVMAMSHWGVSDQ